MAEHQIEDPKIAFAYLRPSCVLLTKEPTVANVEALSGHLRSVSDGALQQLQDYVLFPLRFVLKTPGSKREGLIQAVMEAVTYVLESTCVQSWDSLRDLFSELCLCLCSPKDPGKPATTSEELKLAVLGCLDTLMHSAYGDIVFKLYEPSMLPGLGAAVSLLLALAEHEKARGVQTASLKCLLSLFQQCDCEEEHIEPGRDERYLLGRTLATFLPGISRALSLVISGDVRQGHTVTMKAMRVWYKAVGLVMADEQLQKTDNDVAAGDLGRVGELVVKRTPSWRRTTSQRLALVLQKIISCTSAHPHWRVRLELVNLSHFLLSQCSQSVGECVGLLLEALVGAVNDEEPEVKHRCNAALDEVAQMGQTNGRQDFTDILSENLHSLASSLPRLMRTSDDQRKLFVLNVFLGYLKILGPKVDAVLSSAVHLERISKALMQVMELDVMDVKIIEERTLTSSTDLRPDLHQIPSQRKYFLYFTDDKIFSALRKICRMLGYYGNLYLLVDRFMELYRESSVYRKQAALVLNEVIVGAAGIGVETDTSRIDCSGTNQSRTNQEDLKSSVMSIIEEYISLSNWHLPTVSEALEGKLESTTSLVSNSPERNCLQLLPASKTPTLHQLNGNIWQICIQLEGIGGFALALGTDFRLLLMTTLYPVLEKAGDESLLVSQAAFSTMCDLCKACDYSSPKELVIKNSDYLLNDISLNLARPSIHPHAPRVLAVMFTHSDASLLPLVADVVQNVLTALDLSYDQRAPQFCSVLHSLMKALVRWFPATMGHQKTPSKETQNKECVNLRQFLLDYKKQKELAEGIGVEEEDPNDLEVPPPTSDEDTDGPAEKKELSLHIQIAKDLIERCIHLLSDSNLRIRLKVLDILELCVCVLCEREDELLPMVHRCWPALLHRLTNDDPLAVPRAFKVLCVLGESCGDFLRKRVSKEVLPRLTSSLMKQAEVSARSGPVYTHTLAYKLQLAVLQGLGPLCVKLDLMEADLDRVIDACLLYLSCRQPIKLQEACLSVFRSLMDLDCDLCWFSLNELCCPVTYLPPPPHLLAVTLTGSDKPRNQFTDNILTLLQESDAP
ncbi:TELO2-interacting protein 1 homolog [Sinocyclocheilus rhinocerous]|uniref:TELO2-interacting protein 1 homolog n=1 Tax=Sinocyclocheilus rhinocerous TaxID=307959 RepID=A0A673MPS0_9TELE|nr:PREDICTED: TELO2-interacting protein 1 homolog [Sinocyclocheilus rhinocerous]XP_016423588.1 PREDICTED: TELO2-interacting protein 1 homolog [Sinocyclocheilus rhinocerous]